MSSVRQNVSEDFANSKGLGQSVCDSMQSDLSPHILSGKDHVCRVPKCPTALNVRQILFFSKSVILVTKININSKISKYFKKIISEKYSESNLEKKLPDI